MLALWLLACDGEVEPGDSSTEPTESASEPADSPDSGEVASAPRLNEAQASDDWVELYNHHAQAVVLDGLELSDGSNEQGLSGTLAPGGFLVVDLDFGLSSEGETLTLAGPEGRVLETLAVPALREGHSYGVEQRVTEEWLVAPGAPALFAPGENEGAEQPDHDDEDWVATDQAVGAWVPGDGGDLAAGAPTDQSTDGWGRTGPEAVDGNPATFTHTNTADFEPWWRVDLGGSALVSEVRLINRLDCCRERLYNITVQGLGADDAVLWQSEELNPTEAGPTDPGDLVWTLDPPATANHVRVLKRAVGGTYDSEWLSLAEVHVDGAHAPEWADRVHGALDAAPDQAGWLRIPFTWSGEAPERLVLTVDSDEDARAWLNGAEVDEGAVDPGLLVEGENWLALRAESTDDAFLLGATLRGEWLQDGDLAWFVEPTPGEPNGEGFDGYAEPLVVDPPRGFYEQPIEVRVESPGSRVVVTTDGSEPTLDNGQQADDALTVAIDTTSFLRVAAFAEGKQPALPQTHTYLYLEDVVRQPSSPEGMPATWAGAGQSAVSGDYEMDPEVVDASLDELLAGLRDVPTLSIVMPHEDLWGDDEGLYIHSTQRGAEWEREASLELILPDGSTGFAERSGVRIHGYGWRPHTNSRKHSLRLEFRGDYGPTKLEYPLFERAPVDRFDSIVLRAQGSRSWQDFRDPEQAQYLRDTFARDTAYDMGKQEGHATYVHLYLNGLYWGLYNPVERPDADFGAERFGGEAEDYDAINRRTTTNEAIDGTLDAYLELLALADQDLSTDEGYAAVAEVLDVLDLIDYMLIHQYTANRDGPELFSSNNMRGVRRRDGGLWRFFVWDMEYSLWYATDHINVDVDVPGSISHVYARLRGNAEFRQQYAARARTHLTDGGALTPEACMARYDARAEQIERAVLAESARWGDTDRATPYTRDVEWAEERRRLMEEFFPTRTGVLIEQLTAAGLY